MLTKAQTNAEDAVWPVTDVVQRSTTWGERRAESKNLCGTEPQNVTSVRRWQMLQRA